MKNLRMKAETQSVCKTCDSAFCCKNTELIIMNENTVTPLSIETFFLEYEENICLTEISKSEACQLRLINLH